MFKSLFEKTDSYWLCLIITAILCFGFAITHSSMGIDDERIQILTLFTSIIIDNRLGNIITAKLIPTQEFLPFWRDFFALLLLMTGITIHVNNFIKYLPEFFDRKAAIIFSCTALSFPYIAFYFIFMITCIEHGLIIILSGLAVDYIFRYFDRKNKKYLFFVFLLLFLVLSFYEMGLLYFIISSLFIILIKLMFIENRKSYNKEIIYIFLIPAVLFAVMNFILFLLLNNSQLLRTGDFFNYDLSGINAFFESLWFNTASFLQRFKNTLNYNFGSIILLLTGFIFILLTACFSLKRKNMLILILGIIIILLPFTPFIVTGNYGWPFRVYSAYSFVGAAAFSLLYILFAKNKLLLSSLILIICLVIIQQSKEMNQIFYTEYLKAENDKLFAHSIMQDIKRLELEEKPVIFLGARENPHLKHTYEEADEINVSIFNWDKYDNPIAELFSLRSVRFMRELGYNIVLLSETDMLQTKEQRQKLEEAIKNISKDMAIYPKDKSIKDMGEYVVIKTGPSEWDKQCNLAE